MGAVGGWVGSDGVARMVCVRIMKMLARLVRACVAGGGETSAGCLHTRSQSSIHSLCRDLPRVETKLSRLSSSASFSAASDTRSIERRKST